MNSFIEIIFPMYANHIYNKKVQSKINDLTEGKANVTFNDNVKGINVEVYKERYSETFKVKDKLEDKAKTNVIGITITISLILGATGIVSTISDKYSNVIMEWITFGILSATIIYMISAGILAIQVLITNNKMYFVNLETQRADDDQALLSDYKDCTNLNQLQNTIRNNSIFTSYECIRNALFCLFLIFIFVSMPVNTSEKTKGENWVITHDNSSQYEFLYSASAINFIKMNDSQKIIEDTIIDNIEHQKVILNSDESIGIADNVNKIYIKYRYTNNTIDVLLIEFINNSVNP